MTDSPPPPDGTSRRTEHDAATGPTAQADPALRRRMKRQAQVMLLVAFLVLLTTFSVPFVLRYLEIKIP